MAFLVVVWLTDNLTWSAASGMALGVAQIGWQLLRHRPIEALQWLSLVQILAAGTAALVGDVATRFGFVWAGLMFFTAALNVVLALTLDTKTWSVVMSFWGLGSNIGLFLLQYAVMDWIARRRTPAAKTPLAGNAV